MPISSAYFSASFIKDLLPLFLLVWSAKAAVLTAGSFDAYRCIAVLFLNSLYSSVFRAFQGLYLLAIAKGIEDVRKHMDVFLHCP